MASSWYLCETCVPKYHWKTNSSRSYCRLLLGYHCSWSYICFHIWNNHKNWQGILWKKHNPYRVGKIYLFRVILCFYAVVSVIIGDHCFFLWWFLEVYICCLIPKRWWWPLLNCSMFRAIRDSPLSEWYWLSIRRL